LGPDPCGIPAVRILNSTAPFGGLTSTRLYKKVTLPCTSHRKDPAEGKPAGRQKGLTRGPRVSRGVFRQGVRGSPGWIVRGLRCGIPTVSVVL
jgi:hypothetical protein